MHSVSDLSGRTIPPGKGATIRVALGRTKRAIWELRVTQEEAERLLGRRSHYALDQSADRPLRQVGEA